MKFFAWLTCLFFYQPVAAQSWWQPAIQSSLFTTTYAEQSADVFSFIGNKAALSGVKQVAAGIYGGRIFMLEGLGQYQAAMVYPLKQGAAGVDLRYAGSSLYNETRFGLAYARSLAKAVSVGVQFNYNGIKAAGYGKASVLSADIGLLIRLNAKWRTGVQIDNPVTGRFGIDKQERVPSIYSFGIGYEPGKQLFIQGILTQQDGQSMQAAFSVQYQPVPVVFVRAGILTQNSSWIFGVGFVRSMFRIDIISNYQQRPGFSPGIMILLRQKKDKEQ